MKKLAAALAAAILLLSLSACAGQPPQTSALEGDAPAPTSDALPAGEIFQLGDETYALEKWVALPVYDTDTTIGCGVCLLQKEGVAPVMVAGNSYKSLIDMALPLTGAELATSSIGFVNVEDAPGYRSRVTFEFALPRGEALPAAGSVFHTGTNQKLALDLSTLEPLPIEAAPKLDAPAAVAPAPDDFGKQAFFGEWVLDSIIFRTPDEDNGIYAIDATMSISEGFTYGRDLALREDMSMFSFIDLSALIDAVPELPFAANDLDLKEYAGWAYANGTITFTKEGPSFTAVYDEASEELRLTRSGEVAILSGTVKDMITKSGEVLIDITMVLKPK